MEFIKRIFESGGIQPPEICNQSFTECFPEAMSPEWHDKNDDFEVIFYRNDLEHIALFNPQGLLLEYRQNLPSNRLPLHIRDIIAAKGEIMNSVLKNKGNLIEYELITRNSAIERFQLTITDDGRIIRERKL